MIQMDDAAKEALKKRIVAIFKSASVPVNFGAATNCTDMNEALSQYDRAEDILASVNAYVKAVAGLRDEVDGMFKAAGLAPNWRQATGTADPSEGIMHDRDAIIARAASYIEETLRAVNADPFARPLPETQYLRLALAGVPGSGKTYSSLAIGTGLVSGGRIAVIDSEQGRSAKYRRLFDFNMLVLDSYSPQKYIDAIHAAERQRYDLLIIDSISHEWEGTGGILELHDSAASNADSFRAWGKITPIHDAFIQTILNYQGHIIVTMRAKLKYTLERDDAKKSQVKPLGTQPIQRAGIGYEFDIFGFMDQQNSLRIQKSMYTDISNKVIPYPGKEFGADLRKWLDELSHE